MSIQHIIKRVIPTIVDSIHQHILRCVLLSNWLFTQHIFGTRFNYTVTSTFYTISVWIAFYIQVYSFWQSHFETYSAYNLLQSRLSIWNVFVYNIIYHTISFSNRVLYVQCNFYTITPCNVFTNNRPSNHHILKHILPIFALLHEHNSTCRHKPLKSDDCASKLFQGLTPLSVKT